MRSNNTFLKSILLLSLLGILVSGWLLNTHIKFSTGQAGLTEGCSIPGFGSGEGCANVAVSQYSDVAGVPLAAIAMGFYVALILLVFWAMRNYQAAYEPLYVGFFLSTLSIVVTVIMFCISRFVLKSFCIGCSCLWIINLLIWPSFVKHLGLSWANALGANLELIRHKALNLKRERIFTCLAVSAVSLLTFSVIGASAKGLQTAQAPREATSVMADFESGTQTFLPADAAGGPSAKGAVGGAAPIMDIVEFADFQCPGCRAAAQFIKPFVRKHGDKVRFTYRNFPLDGSCNRHAPNGSHRMSCASSRAAICSGGQGKFFEMHDLIFDNQESLTTDMLNEFASKIGLDAEKFAACLKDPATDTQLMKEIEWGEQIGLQSTPTLVINGRRLSGARSPGDLEVLLTELEKARK